MNPKKKTGFEQINLGATNPIQPQPHQSFTLSAPSTNNSETLAQMQARVANQNKPGYDVFGSPVQQSTPKTTQGTSNNLYPGQQTPTQAQASAQAAGVAPVTGSAPTATQSSTIGSLYGDYASPQTFGDYQNNYALTPQEEQAIRDQKTAALQSEIDATNLAFAEQLKNMRRQSNNSTGQLGAIQARRGLLGSDFGASQSNTLQQDITANENDLESKRLAAITRILTQGKTDAEQAIQDKINARQQGYQSYITYLKDQEAGRPTRAKTAAQRFLAANIDPTQSDFAEVARSYGINQAELVSAYNEAKLAKDKSEAETQKLLDQQQKDKRYITLGDGATLYDTQTGQTVAQNEKNFAPQRLNVNFAGLTPYQQLQAEGAIEKTYYQRTQDAKTVMRNYAIIEGSVADIKKNLNQGKSINAQSQSVIMAFNKILDPLSVVREGEYARTAEGQAILNRLDGYITRITSGGQGISTADLDNIASSARQISELSRDYELQQAELAQNRADRYGLTVDTPTTPSSQIPTPITTPQGTTKSGNTFKVLP